MRTFKFAAILLAAALCAAARPASAQFEAPEGALELEETGSLETVSDGMIAIRDSKNDGWLVKISDDTNIVVDGDAEPGCLRPGFSVQFTAELDKKLAPTKPIEEVVIVTPKGKNSIGLFAEGDDNPEAKPIKAPGAGTYLVKGKLISFRDGALTVLAGPRKITANLGEEAKVKLNLDDASLAQVGDMVKVKLWYYPNSKPNPALNTPGKGVAEEVTITLANPLTAGKKARVNSKSTVRSGKSSR